MPVYGSIPAEQLAFMEHACLGLLAICVAVFLVTIGLFFD